MGAGEAERERGSQNRRNGLISGNSLTTPIYRRREAAASSSSELKQSQSAAFRGPDHG